MAASDPPVVRNEDEHLLRDFCAARDRGDAAAMKAPWGRLVENNVDRVRGFVDSLAPAVLSREEREDAAQGALIQAFNKMIASFEGSTTNAFYAALYSCTRYAVLSEHRRGAKHLARTKYVDEPAGADDEGGYDRVLLEESRARLEAEERAAQATRTLEAVLPRMTNTKQRTVVERTLDGVPVPEIAAELGTSDQNVHQLRSRGFRELRALINERQDHDA